MTANRIPVAEIVSRLRDKLENLATDLLPGGKREGREWRAGSVAGEAGHSLGVHLIGAKRGVWSDFAAGIGGDPLDLVAAVNGTTLGDALVWSRRWLGLEDGAEPRPKPPPPRKPAKPMPAGDGWRKAWQSAKPIFGTRAEKYIKARGLYFDDLDGLVLRFAPEHGRRNPETAATERHPALLVLLRDVKSGDPCGIINVYLRADGCDRLRDKKGKSSWGRAGGAAALLSPFDEPTLGLTICEGVETGIALLMHDLAPVWACGGAGNLAGFPVLGGIEALTIAADADEPGQKAAEACAGRWREAGREAVIVAPPTGDWADPHKGAVQ